MFIEQVNGKVKDELEYADEGFCLENPRNGRRVTVVEYPRERYQLAKGGMVAGLTNNVTVAVNFLFGG